MTLGAWQTASKQRREQREHRQDAQRDKERERAEAAEKGVLSLRGELERALRYAESALYRPQKPYITISPLLQVSYKSPHAAVKEPVFAPSLRHTKTCLEQQIAAARVGRTGAE